MDDPRIIIVQKTFIYGLGDVWHNSNTNYIYIYAVGGGIFGC